MTYRIRLNVPTGEVNGLGDPKCIMAHLTTESIYSRYDAPVFDIGDDRDYGPSEIVPRFGRTASELVVAAFTTPEYADKPSGPMLTSSLFLWSSDDAHPDDRLALAARQWEGVQRFLRQWPDGPQLPEDPRAVRPAA